METMVKNKLRQKPRSFLSQIIKNFNSKQHPLQNTVTTDQYNLMSLGTEYGGWTFVETPSLHGATIISAGLGEDASFDVEFATRFNARVIIIDPTPRAIEHYEKIHQRVGQANSTDYVSGGDQPVESYDLSKINNDQLILEKRALWTEQTKVNFYQPKDPETVSYSIVNFQNDYVNDGPYIEVDTCTIEQLLTDYEIDASSFELLKLDIEGAEIEVIDAMIRSGIYPTQICVEFDELQMKTKRAFKRVDQINDLLVTNGYECAHTDGRIDFLFVRKANF